MEADEGDDTPPPPHHPPPRKIPRSIQFASGAYDWAHHIPDSARHLWRTTPEHPGTDMSEYEFYLETLLPHMPKVGDGTPHQPNPVDAFLKAIPHAAPILADAGVILTEQSEYTLKQANLLSNSKYNLVETRHPALHIGLGSNPLERATLHNFMIGVKLAITTAGPTPPDPHRPTRG